MRGGNFVPAGTSATPTSGRLPKMRVCPAGGHCSRIGPSNSTHEITSASPSSGSSNFRAGSVLFVG